MPAIISTNFRLENANNFRSALSEAGNKAYVFIGKSDSWSPTLGDPTEFAAGVDVPATPHNTIVELNDSWQNMIAMKEITTSGVINMAPRHDWVASTIYPAWDDNDSFVYDTDNAFYVLTTDFNVYKCVYSPGTASTTKPSHTTVNPTNPGDGYLWKYMYTIQAVYTDFLTINYMPVKTVLSAPGGGEPDITQWNNQVGSAALDGKIYRIVVVNGGTGYNPSVPPAVTILGDGAGVTATAVVNASAPFNVTGINVTNTGTSAYNTVNVTVAAPVTGTTATARAVLSPKGGHGTRAAEELGGFYVGIIVSLEYSEDPEDPEYGNFITDGSFRQLGIIKNPYVFGTTDVGTETTYSALKHLVVTSPSNIAVGDYIDSSISGANAYIDSWDSATGTLKYHQNDKTGYVPFATGVFTTSTAGSGTITTIVDQDVEPFSGQILFLENRTKIDRSATQIEDVKLIIEF